MLFILIILLYFLIGLLIAYFKTPNRDQSFDLNKETLLASITWPKVIYNLFVK